jgi:hypothetical protein
MLATPVLALAAALTVAMATPAALVGKLSTTLGFEGFGSLKVNTLIDKMLSPAGGSGKSDMTTAVNAAWAAVLFLLAAAVIIGVVRFATGSRGAGERIAAVLGGVVGLLVALNILA